MELNYEKLGLKCGLEVHYNSSLVELDEIVIFI